MQNGSSGRRTALLSILLLLMLFSYGCMTTDDVRVQMNPLFDRMCDLESRQISLESKIATLGKRVETIPFDKEGLDLKVVCCDRGGVAIAAAEAASKRAQSAASMAETFSSAGEQ